MKIIKTKYFVFQINQNFRKIKNLNKSFLIFNHFLFWLIIIKLDLKEATPTPSSQNNGSLLNEGKTAHPDCTNCPYYLMERMQRECFMNTMLLFNYKELMTRISIVRACTNFSTGSHCQPFWIPAKINLPIFLILP